jgi:hypothetical protein
MFVSAAVRKVSRKGVVHQSLFCDIDFVPRRIATKRQYLQSDHAIPNVVTATFGIAFVSGLDSSSNFLGTLACSYNADMQHRNPPPVLCFFGYSVVENG